MTPIYFFGTLRDADLLAVVIGRPIGAGDVVTAHAPGREARLARGHAYPVLCDAPGRAAEGVVFHPASADEVEAIAYYEEAEYDLVAIEVETEDGPVAARHFAATAKIGASETPFDLAAWQARAKTVAIEAARELMPLRAHLPAERMDAVAWPGIMNRARQRARAMAETPVLAGIRHDFSRERDVEWVAHERPLVEYLAVERHTVRHRLFSGGMSAPVHRHTAAWGDAVTVLPWDPRLDRVVLIEQFRPGAAARMDPNPWCVEVPAGRIDADEDAETAIRREAEEETGLTLGRVERYPGYYPTPGLSTEHLGAFVGEADLSGGGEALQGAAGEGEDIRAFTLSTDEAVAAMRAGAVNTGPAQILLLWLALDRGRLAALWQGRGDGPGEALRR
ncbi:MAG: NUDIX domain-containing protein [Paracoccaceae bacterium]